MSSPNYPSSLKYSVGFSFEDPLNGYLDGPDMTSYTLAKLMLAVAFTERGDMVYSNTINGCISESAYFWVQDGIVELNTCSTIKKGKGVTQKLETVINFIIFEQLKGGGSSTQIKILIDSVDVEPYVEEQIKPSVDSDQSPEISLYLEALSANVDARLDEIPDALPRRIDKGTMTEDILYAELFDATKHAIPEVLPDLLEEMRNMPPEYHQQIEDNFRQHRLTEKLANKALQIIDPLVYGRLS